MAGENRQDPAGGAGLSGVVVSGPGFKIRYTDEQGYLRAHVYDGVDSRQVSIAMWRMLADECRARGVTRLMVLEELQGSVDRGEIEETIDAMDHAGMAAFRIVFVELLDDIEGSEYVEILCLERGIIVRVFNDEDAARRWLLYGD